MSEAKPLNWSLLNNDSNRDLWEHYRRLIDIHKENAALCSDNFASIAKLWEPLHIIR